MLSRILHLPKSLTFKKQILFAPLKMSRSGSTSPRLDSSRVLKRQKLDHEDPNPNPNPEAESHGDERAVMSEAEMVEKEMGLPIEFVKTYKHELDYRNKLVLAPMVRTGSLPMRLLSLYYGAGLVWSPEVVDRAIIGSERVVDPETGVIIYTKGQGPIFATHPMEKPYLIFQIGSSDPDLAVQAAKMVEQDVAGIDLNCGCPKPFSTHSGMGAALLSTPDLLLNILRKLLDNIPLPISCKIRMLPTQPSTLVLVSRIIRTGIRNLTVHCRTRDMRPGERAMWERLGDIVELGKRRDLPIICNGDGDGWSNWERIRTQTNADSVMLARAAEKNPSVFLPAGPRCNVTEIIPQLLRISQYIKNPWGNTKFLLTQFKPSPPPISKMTKVEKKDFNELISKSKSVEEVAEKMGVDISPEACRGLMDEIEGRIQERVRVELKKGEGEDVFEERKEKEEAGEVVDEPTESEDLTATGVEEKADAESKAEVDGWEVGVGQAGDVEGQTAVAPAAAPPAASESIKA